MAFTTIDNPELYFQLKLYTGNGGTNAITLGGDEDMQPDFVWIADRTRDDNHPIFDSVRGAQKEIQSDSTAAEVTRTASLSAFAWLNPLLPFTKLSSLIIASLLPTTVDCRFV